MKILKYVLSRFTTLKPPLNVPPNPIKLLRTLNRRQVAFFLVGFFAWTLDAFDFVAMILNVVTIGETYDKSPLDIIWAITLTLMFRSVGAILFGLINDRVGRKWPFIINIILYALIEIATGFCVTYTQFITVRALFGIVVGGIYGNCATTALEDTPIETRGLLSGLLQQGFACGYLIAFVFNYAITSRQRYGWRALFWFGGGPPLLIALWRILLPETEAFLDMKKVCNTNENTDEFDEKLSSMRSFFHSIRLTLLHHWPTLIYLVLMMTGLNILLHYSQDIYPTCLESTLHFTRKLVSITTIVANCGAIIGGMLVGYFSSFFGRRLSIIIVLVIGATLIPAYVFPRNKTFMIGAFFQQMCVQGVWGVVPIHLMELSPVNFRSFVVGTAYQLGNLISASSSTIEAKTGQNFPITTEITQSTDEKKYDYTRIIGIFLACVYVYLIIIIVLGPEKRNIDEITSNNNTTDDYNDRRSDIQLKESLFDHHLKVIENV